jgi:hypothetical protein
VREQIFYACQEFNSRDDRLRSSFLKHQFREILDRTMVVPGKAVTEAIRRKPEEIYDNSFVSNLEKSGFLKEIWGSENYRR